MALMRRPYGGGALAMGAVMAAGRGHTAMVLLLAENGADLYFQNDHEETGLLSTSPMVLVPIAF